MKGEIVSKEYNKVSKHDTILAKIILTYRDKILSYKVEEYETPYQIKNRIKHKNEFGKQTYLILYIPSTKEYTFNTLKNKKRFKNKEEMKDLFYKYSYFPPEERNYFYGITE